MRLLRPFRFLTRHSVRSLRTLLQALVLLGVLLCVVEVGVRVYEWQQGPGGGLTGGAGEPLLASFAVGHGLRPLSAWSASPGSKLVVRTNSLGLRGPEPVIPKPGGLFRVVCLGDERVLGADVPRRLTFCHKLQEQLQARTTLKVEVLNAGVPGYCPLQSLLQVRHGLLPLEADLWVLVFDMSDVADDYRLRPRLIVGRDGRPLACPHPSLSAGNGNGNVWQTLCRRFRLVDLASRQAGRWWTRGLLEAPTADPGSRQGQYAWLIDNPPDWSVHIEQALDPIARLARLARGRLVVAVCPAPWQVADDETAGREVRQRLGIAEETLLSSLAPFRVVSEFTSRHAIPLCDTSSGFREAAAGAALFLEDRPALSQEGHALFARLLTAGLTARPASVAGATPAEGVRPVSAESPVRILP